MIISHPKPLVHHSEQEREYVRAFDELLIEEI